MQIQIQFQISVCPFLDLLENGFCNDEANTPDCNYDGGDCCLSYPNKEYCIHCTCHLLETCLAGTHPLIGNGICNDVTNIAECSFDGLDCCGFDINGNGEYNYDYEFEVDTSACTECICHGMYMS